jgi:hypothetical protein
MMVDWTASRGCATLFLASHVEWWCVRSNLCRRRSTLGRNVGGMSVQSVVMEAGMPRCVRRWRGGVDGGSCRETRKRRGVSVAVPGGLRDISSAAGRGEDCVLAYTDVRALVI